MKTTAHKAPGKSCRQGISIMELADMFPTEDAARDWFEQIMWNAKRCCGHCGSHKTRKGTHKTMPYWCSDCRRHFSVKTGTALASSKVPLRKWAFAIYFWVTNLKGVSSMKLHRDLKVSQPTAWFMLHRLREAWERPGDLFTGPVEVDETYMGGKRKNMSNAKGKELTGRGPVGKTAVVGAKDRKSNQVAAMPVEHTDAETLQGFISQNTKDGAQVYTDEATGYQGLPFAHETVKHSVKEYVNGQAHTNGIESFWAMLKRGYHGVYHRMSPQHLQRYVNEFAGRHNIRDKDTIDQMNAIVSGLVGKRLLWKKLISCE